MELQCHVFVEGRRLSLIHICAVVGTLLEVGRGKLTIGGFRRVIEQKDRCRAGTSVPGNALFLVDVAYPEETFISG